MDLEKYPIDTLSDEELLNRMVEECSELIQAIAKRKRFGRGSRHPRTGLSAEEHICNEMDDVKLILKEVENRLSADGSFDPISDEYTYWGGYHR